ncbi:hypothetical protein GCM10027597_32280 [Saccharopolyspora tripterygii]
MHTALTRVLAAVAVAAVAGFADDDWLPRAGREDGGGSGQWPGTGGADGVADDEDLGEFV